MIQQKEYITIKIWLHLRLIFHEDKYFSAQKIKYA